MLHMETWVRALERLGRILKWYERPLTDGQRKRAPTRVVDVTTMVLRWLSR